MKFSHAILYAINAMVYLAKAESGVPVPCRQIAQAGKMPERFLLQVLRVLVTRGLLHSTRGVDGGYFLSKLPQEITLAEIFDAFDNPLDFQLPAVERIINNGAEHQLNLTLRNATEAARIELEKATLDRLIELPSSTQAQTPCLS